MSLPNGVQELQWVKANGNVYLDTTFNPNQNTRVVADVEWDASATTSWLFGARNGTNRGAFAFLTYKSAYRADYGSATTTLSVLPSGRFTVEMDKNVVKINGETVATASSQNFTTNYPMVLFANNTAGTISGYTTAKLYSLKIYDNGTLVRDYIPVRSTSGTAAGLIALYDAVHNIVHGPSGSGDFEAGPEKTEDQAHKALIDGTARDVTSGTCLVGGTAYAIKKGRTLIGGTGYDISFVSYDPVFANNEWADIIAACQSRNVPDTWTVGSQKSMTIGGSSYLVDIIGLNHDDYADGSGKAPLTLQLHDCYITSSQMSYSEYNYDSWKQSLIRLYFCPNTILANMQTDVKVGIKNVNKFTATGGGDATLITTSDKLFLLAESEVFASINQSFAGEGSRYEYYTNGGTSSLKKNNVQNYMWWLRSPVSWNNYNYCAVHTVDGISYYSGPQAALGVCPAFCF